MCIYLGPDWDLWGHMEPCWQGPQGAPRAPLGLPMGPGPWGPRGPKGYTCKLPIHRHRAAVPREMIMNNSR